MLVTDATNAGLICVVHIMYVSIRWKIFLWQKKFKVNRFSIDKVYYF